MWMQNTSALEYCIDWTQDHNWKRKSSIWRLVSKFCSVFNFKMVLEQILFIFEQRYADAVDICKSTSIIFANARDSSHKSVRKSAVISHSLLPELLELVSVTVNILSTDSTFVPASVFPSKRELMNSNCNARFVLVSLGAWRFTACTSWNKNIPKNKTGRPFEPSYAWRLRKLSL